MDDDLRRDAASAKADAQRRPRVAIVDDDAEMRALLRDVLERSGWSVREHASGEALLPSLDAAPPDAIVLDNVMAGAAGLDLLSCIRQRLPRTPVVLVTAFGGAEVEAEALRLGATYYMDKPFRVARLVAVLRAAVGKAARSAACRWAEYG